MRLVCFSTNIRFPNLGIELKNVPKEFSVFNIQIALYGIMIAIGVLCGYLIAARLAKRSGQDKEQYLDFALYAIFFSVIGARICYVAFSWESFRDDPLSIFNLRTGGLAIYGAVIAAVLTALIYCRIKKRSFFLLADTGIPGLLAGQVIGRWGNFFNREVFGRYTDSLFAMQINIRDAGYEFQCTPEELRSIYAGKSGIYSNILELQDHSKWIDAVEYIQVHPTFLYESLWNLVLLVFLLAYWKHRKFDGEIFFLYMAGYGIGRFIIEGIRIDQLFLWGTSIPVFQLVSGVMAAAGLLLILVKRIRLRKNKA